MVKVDECSKPISVENTSPCAENIYNDKYSIIRVKTSPLLGGYGLAVVQSERTKQTSLVWVRNEY